MVRFSVPYAYGCTVRVYAYGTKYAYGIEHLYHFYFTAQVCSSYMLMLSDSITEVGKLFQSMTALQWKEGMPVHVAKYLNEVVRVVVSS